MVHFSGDKKDRTCGKMLLVRSGCLDHNFIPHKIARVVQSQGFRVVTASWTITNTPILTPIPNTRSHVFRFNIYRGFLLRILGHIFWLAYVVSIIVRERPNIVHSLNSVNMAAVLALKPILRYRVVFDMRDPYGLMTSAMPFPIPQLFSLYERLCARFSDSLMDCQGDNDVMQDYIGKWASRGRNIANVLCVPDFPFPVEPVPLRSDKFVINISGHISVLRGALLAIEAFKDYDNVLLEFVGDLPKPDILATIEASPNAVHLGKILYKDAIEKMRRSCLVWLNYSVDLKAVAIASSNKMFEAMACSRPYVASEGSWMGLIAEKYDLGFTVPYGNVDQLRRLIDRLIANPNLISEAGARGREVYLRQYTWDTAKQPLVDEYAGLAGLLPSR